MVDYLLGLAEYAGPFVAAALTVPVLQWIKSLLSVLDRAPAFVKQASAVIIGYSLTELGAFLNVHVPTSLELFTGSDVEGLLSGGIAMAIYAGRKASGTSRGFRTISVALLLGLAPTAGLSAQPGPIENLHVRQTGPGIISATWNGHPDPIIYVVRWGPVGVHWGLKFDPSGDYQNEHRTDLTGFVLSGVEVGQTGEIQVVAYDSTATGSARYGPISEPAVFQAEEWENPDPGEPAPDTVRFPAITRAEFPENPDEFYLTLPDSQVIKMSRVWKWLDFGWHGVWGVWIGTPR